MDNNMSEPTKTHRKKSSHRNGEGNTPLQKTVGEP